MFSHETNVDDKTGKVDGESEQTGKEAKKNEPEKEKVQEEVTKDKQDGARQGTIGEPI